MNSLKGTAATEDVLLPRIRVIATAGAIAKVPNSSRSQLRGQYPLLLNCRNASNFARWTAWRENKSGHAAATARLGHRLRISATTPTISTANSKLRKPPSAARLWQ
ncbi:hypothetical protein OUZ56_018963 [Daphnia magna]|uniref:Uncharacterized protein n=1 Tax=Daphnia magna TaxID=35525 RepID=A0ABQ9ZA98_9CRUS|nr:hypothetical protein OUZ56_018963 [Daphnia magna]